MIADPPTGGSAPTDTVGEVCVRGYPVVNGYSDDPDTIIRGGENIYPGEIEDLLHRHPAVAEVAPRRGSPSTRSR